MVQSYNYKWSSQQNASLQSCLWRSLPGYISHTRFKRPSAAQSSITLQARIQTIAITTFAPIKSKNTQTKTRVVSLQLVILSKLFEKTMCKALNILKLCIILYPSDRNVHFGTEHPKRVKKRSISSFLRRTCIHQVSTASPEEQPATRHTSNLQLLGVAAAHLFHLRTIHLTTLSQEFENKSPFLQRTKRLLLQGSINPVRNAQNPSRSHGTFMSMRSNNSACTKARGKLLIKNMNRKHCN